VSMVKVHRLSACTSLFLNVRYSHYSVCGISCPSLNCSIHFTCTNRMLSSCGYLQHRRCMEEFGIFFRKLFSSSILKTKSYFNYWRFPASGGAPSSIRFMLGNIVYLSLVSLGQTLFGVE